MTLCWAYDYFLLHPSIYNFFLFQLTRYDTAVYKLPYKAVRILYSNWVSDRIRQYLGVFGVLHRDGLMKYWGLMKSHVGLLWHFYLFIYLF
jgi:hypothetical protein